MQQIGHVFFHRFIESIVFIVVIITVVIITVVIVIIIFAHPSGPEFIP